MRRFMIITILLALMLTLGIGISSAQSGETTHIVAAGENLFRISLRYNVPLATLAARNNIANVNLIFAGQTLIIPSGSGTTTTGGTTTGGTTTGSTPTTTYTVVRGDTLGAIARRFNTTVSAIASLNGITNPNLIFVGQVLQIGGSSGATTGGTTGGATSGTTGGTTTGGSLGTTFELGGQVLRFAFPDQMRGAKMTWAKIQVKWRRGQGPEIAQNAIDASKSRGFKVLLSIVGEPSELAANPSQYYQEFATFLGGVAGLGADGIEVWNEMNIDREWPNGLISGANYTQMLSAAYQAIKAANPNTLVISGAPSPTGFFQGCSTSGCDDDRYIAQMAAAGAAQFMDCVGVHYNAGTVPPSATSGAPVGSASHYSWYYPSMFNLYASTFPTKPLCFTELGYLTGEGFSTPLPAAFSWANNITVANQAEWLQAAVTRARQSGRVRLLIVWNVDSNQWGDDPQAGYAIVRPDGTCPACNALAVAMQ